MLLRKKFCAVKYLAYLVVSFINRPGGKAHQEENNE